MARRGKLWKATGKAISLQGIMSEDGQALTGDEAAEALASHWGKVFEEKPGNADTFEQFLPFVQTAPRDLCWDISKEEVAKLMAKPKKSTPGPDGISYKIWQLIGEPGVEVIHNICQQVLRGGNAPHGVQPVQTGFSCQRC